MSTTIAESGKGLARLRNLKPVLTPTAKLITMLLDHISMALGDCDKGNAKAAQVQLEYALHEADITLADNREILANWYQPTAVCQRCGSNLSEGEYTICDSCA